jgi:hypothetical protein
MSSPNKTEKQGERHISYAQAIFEATRQEMQRDESVFVMGRGVDPPRGMFGTLPSKQSDKGQISRSSFEQPRDVRFWLATL